MTTLAAIALATLGLLLVGRALPQLRRALTDREHPESPERLLTSLRRLIVGTALSVVAAGVLSGQSWLLLFGLVFLVEEVVECRLHLGLARRGGAVVGARASGSGRLDGRRMTQLAAISRAARNSSRTSSSAAHFSR